MIAEVTVVRVDYNAFKLRVTLPDGGTLRISEQYHQSKLEQYAYYWLDADERLRIGWDNASHHRRLPNVPHHKHVNSQDNLQPAAETTPAAILASIKALLS